VVKKRSGNHEHTIREFQLTPKGVALGPPLRQFSGVFSGTPTYTSDKELPMVHGANDQA
jgi:circadian clock protein KaiC